MNAIDDVIRKTLSAADAELFERYGADQALHRQVLEMFRASSVDQHARLDRGLGVVRGGLLFLVAFRARAGGPRHDAVGSLRWRSLSLV